MSESLWERFKSAGSRAQMNEEKIQDKISRSIRNKQLSYAKTVKKHLDAEIEIRDSLDKGHINFDYYMEFCQKISSKATYARLRLCYFISYSSEILDKKIDIKTISTLGTLQTALELAKMLFEDFVELFLAKKED